MTWNGFRLRSFQERLRYSIVCQEKILLVGLFEQSFSCHLNQNYTFVDQKLESFQSVDN